MSKQARNVQVASPSREAGRGAARREKILRAAIDAFAEKGFDAASTRGYRSAFQNRTGITDLPFPQQAGAMARRSGQDLRESSEPYRRDDGSHGKPGPSGAHPREHP